MSVSCTCCSFQLWPRLHTDFSRSQVIALFCVTLRFRFVSVEDCTDYCEGPFKDWTYSRHWQAIGHDSIDHFFMYCICTFRLCHIQTCDLEVLSAGGKNICKVKTLSDFTKSQNASFSSPTWVSGRNWTAVPLDLALVAYGDLMGGCQYVLWCLHIQG